MMLQKMVLAPLAALLLAGAALAQGTAPPPPAPPPATLTQPAPGGAPPPPAAAPAPQRPTLVPGVADPLNFEEVTLTSKPTVVLPGQSSWDEGFDNLTKAFQRLEEGLAKAGIQPAGRPLSVFLRTDDNGFTYEAMIPIERVPEGGAAPAPDIRFGKTPEGKALRFGHKAPYDDIDSTYETITAYLDAKGIVVKDAFVEEYASDLKDPSDDGLEINIYVQPQ